MSRFMHPIAAMAVELQVTTFHDRRTVELHQQYDEIQRKRFVQRVERGMERKRAPERPTRVAYMPSFFKRQAN